MKYYTVKQAAEILAVSYAFMRLLVESGEIEAANVGRGKEKIWRISEEAIQKYMKKKSNIK